MTAARQWRIIIADDEEPIRFAAKMALKGMGADILDASNGFEVLELLRLSDESNQPVDLLLMDIQMPGCTGLKVLEQLAGVSDSYPAVLLMTGMTAPATEPNGDAYDYAGCLMKPFSMRTLVSEVTTIFARPRKSTYEKKGVKNVRA